MGLVGWPFEKMALLSLFAMLTRSSAPIGTLEKVSDERITYWTGKSSVSAFRRNSAKKSSVDRGELSQAHLCVQSELRFRDF